MNKRVHEIAKERGLSSKDVLARLQAAGIEVKAASSNVDVEVATKVLSDGGDAAPKAAPAKPHATATEERPAPAKSEAPAKPQPAAAEAPAPQAEAPATGPSATPQRPSEHKRPTRDSLQGERAPGAAGGRRRVVIDSQASRRSPGGGPPGQSSQPPRRQRRGRRRRGTYDEEAESRPAAQTAR